MELVEILARELKEWPDGAIDITQGRSGLLYDQQSDIVGRIEYIAENQDYACVTRAQWEAERARIASQSVSMSDEDVAFVKSDFYREMVDRKIEQDLADIACGKRSKEDQELWDKLAIAAMQGLLSSGATYKGSTTNRDLLALDAFAHADAFMAERAKRMKG